MSTYEKGEWVQVWGQVVETDPHPEEITVRMESHNEDYHCLVRRDRVIQVERIPSFAPICGSLKRIDGDLLRRCARVHGHAPDHQAGDDRWTNQESAGWMEEA